MTAHDPRVTLTEAEVDRLNDVYFATDCYFTDLADTVADLIAARLPPIRALADHWEAAGFEIEPAQLREALDAPVSASQDHDGAEGQPATWQLVHNHSPFRPTCNERRVDGQLRGACLNDDGSPR